LPGSREVFGYEKEEDETVKGMFLERQHGD
jgi:hypothetical protein